MMATCNWAAPGANPYRGTLEQALDRYGFTHHEKVDIIWRHKNLRFDTYVVIRKDEVYSPFGGVAWGLRDMHFGNGYCSGLVDRSAWSHGHEEVALVYCSGTRCVAIPRVCGNVSKIEWQPALRNEVLIRPEHDPFAPRPVNEVPEPGTLALALVALAFVATTRRVTPAAVSARR